MSPRKVLEVYESLAEAYDARIDHKPHNAYYDRPATLSLLPPVSGKKILDAGCGPGKYAEVLLAAGAEVTGFDISPKMVALAEKRNKEQGRFFVHDMTQPLPMFDDERFDAVLCALSLDYVEDWRPVLREFKRLLKPGGVLVASFGHPFFEFNYYNTGNYFRTEAVQTIWKGFGKPVMVHSFKRSLGECIAPFTDTGFCIDRLLEPKPTAEFEALDARHFAELNAFPSFMCVRAAKR